MHPEYTQIARELAQGKAVGRYEVDLGDPNVANWYDYQTIFFVEKAERWSKIRRRSISIDDRAGDYNKLIYKIVLSHPLLDKITFRYEKKGVDQVQD